MCVQPQTNISGNTYKCGKCSECHKSYLQHWTFRLQHEMKGTPALFITLTYDYEHIPMNQGKFTLDKKHYQDWLKRLRKRLPNRQIKYVLCGEYGDKIGRPHYHAILIGCGMEDSKVIHDTWGMGHVHFGTAEPASIAYTFKYSVKGSLKQLDYRQVKPFVTMSKGIGETFAFEIKYHPTLFTRKHVSKVTGEVKEIKYTRYIKERIPKPHFKKKLDSLKQMPFYKIPSQTGGTVKMSVPRFYLRAANYDTTELGEIFQQRMTAKYQQLTPSQREYYDYFSPIQRKGEVYTEQKARLFSISKEKI